MRKILETMFKRWIVRVSAIILIIFAICAIFAPLIATWNPDENNLFDVLQGCSAEHFLGTDNYGRDTFSRIIYGARVSLLVGVSSVLAGALAGTVLGLIAGYFGGIIDEVIMRVMEMLMSIPQVVLALSLGAVFGGGLFNLTVILAVSSVPGYVRLIRSQVMSVKESDYVLAARVIGSTDWHIIFRHILHNTFSPMIVMMTQSVGLTILGEAGLSFLGMGVSPPTASWGGMIADGKALLTTAPLVAVTPGVCIVLLVMSLNIVGDALRDALDPRLRGRV